MSVAWSGAPRGLGEHGEADGMGPSVTRAASGRSSPPPLKNGSELRAAGYLVAVGSRAARFRGKHRVRLRRALLLMLLLLLLCLVITLAVLYARARRVRPAAACVSRACLRSAANLALSMDRAADPCDNFYQYACGGWAAQHPRPDGLRSYDWFRDTQARVYARVRDVLARNTSGDGSEPRALAHARTLYAACMDTETLDKLGLQPVLSTLQSLALPARPAALTTPPAGPPAFDWLAAAVRVKTVLAMDVLVGFDIFTDPRNSSRYRLVMGSPETTNPFPSMHNKRKRHTGRGGYIVRGRSRGEGAGGGGSDARAAAAYRRYYAELMRAVLEAAGEQADPTAEPGETTPESEQEQENEHDLQQTILQAADDYYIFSEKLYELETANDTESDEELYSQVPEYTAAALLALTGGDAGEDGLWARYLRGVFAVSDVTLDLDEDKVLVSAPDLAYLTRMVALVDSAPPATVELYVWMKVVEVTSVHTTRELRLLAARARETARGGAGEGGGGGEGAPRGLHCAGVADDMLGMAVAYAIADPNFLNETKPKIETMLQEMKYALAHLVGRAPWMDDDTKLATYRKISQMRSLVGFPEWLLEPDALDEYYAGVTADPSAHLQNMILINQVKIKKALNRFRDSNNFTWASDPTEVNAYHTFQENTITVPLVMLQYPFYDLGLDSLNYGSLGTILGHEITHGFDNFGRQFDADGNLLPWWSNSTVAGFLNMTQCFVQQYSEYYLPEIDEYVDGRRTLGENLADNGGVREAFLALRRHLRARTEPTLPGFEGFTPEQLFFLSYGNLWCGVWTAPSLASEAEDEHAPQRLRARGALSNSAEFAAAWRCRPGTDMNPRPDRRCRIF